MTLLGHEAIHTWNAPGTTPADIEIGRVWNDAGTAMVWPRVELLPETNLQGLGESGLSSHKRVGRSGVVPRRSYRGAKLSTYIGIVRARSLLELRNYQATLRAAFADQSVEGRMDVKPHPLATSLAGLDRFYKGRPVGLEMVDQIGPSKFSSTVALGIEWSDPRYFETLTDLTLAARIDELYNPALYWTLGATNGLIDQSGNGRNGTAQGGVTVGGAAGLTGVAGGAATDLDGVNDYISSSYDPGFGIRTLIGMASRDASANADALVGATDAGRFNVLLASGAQDVILKAGNVTSPGLLGWPGNAQSVFWEALIEQTNPAPNVTTNLKMAFGGATPTQQYNTGLVAQSSFGSGGLSLGIENAASFFDGKMGPFMVFERVLASSERAGIHELVSTGLRTYD